MTLAAMSAKITFQGEQISYLVENEKILHKALVDGFADMRALFDQQNRKMEAEFHKSRLVSKVWSSITAGSIVVVLKILWDKLVETWNTFHH